MSEFLVVAQKPSVERAIKKVFKDEYNITSVSGHIFELTFDKFKIAPWLKTSLENLLTDKLKYEVKSKSVSNLRNQKFKTLILAMDPDEQGQTISKHVTEFFNIKDYSCVKMVKLESLAPKDIKEAFKKQIAFSSSMGLAGQLRAKLDLWFGAILSRFVSLALFKKNKYWQTYFTGRVQTPTLKFIIDREREIKEFKPEEYKEYRIKEGVLNDVKLEGLYEEKPGLVETYFKLKSIEDFLVPPRKGLNTDKLLQLMSQEHAIFKKINSKTMAVLNDLYLKGYISYPRTDNEEYNNYPTELNQCALLFESYYNKKAIVPLLKKTNVTTDHAPITPLVLKSEDPIQNKVLLTLYRHMGKIFSGFNSYKKLTYEVQGKEYSFLKPIEINYVDGRVSYDLPLCDFKVRLSVEQGVTKPPPSYTTSSLLTQMKRKGVGTKSTRAVIIENLEKNGYLKCFNNKLSPSKKAYTLEKFLSEKAPLILFSNLTKEIECKFKEIDNEKELERIENHYKDQLRKIVNSI